MNLRALANGLTRTVNPNVSGTHKRATGTTKAADKTRTPTYQDNPVTLQVQALSGGALMHADALNIQGIKRAIYADTRLQGANRPDGGGGDLVIIPAQAGFYVPLSGGASDTFLIVEVLEPWDVSGWSKAIGVLQK